jgi:mono/diheme cytochrome c family protein
VIRKALFVLLLAIIVFVLVYAAFQKQYSTVPEEAKRVTNPLQPSGTLLKGAYGIYFDKCAECHGNAGKGDGRQASMYDPPPSNFTDARRMSSVTDGELFYRISEGGKPMPAFKRKLTEEQRWQVVLLLRAFATPSAIESKSGATGASSSTASGH